MGRRPRERAETHRWVLPGIRAALPILQPRAGEGMARKKKVGGSIPPELAQLRDSIDNIDAALIHLLAERFRCTRRVGELKAVSGMPPADPGRERVMIKRLKALAKDAKLDPAFAEKFLNFIIAEVIRHHESLRGCG
jgi:chorismate mutase